jgi:hypothetical protein
MDNEPDSGEINAFYTCLVDEEHFMLPRAESFQHFRLVFSTHLSMNTWVSILFSQSRAPDSGHKDEQTMFILLELFFELMSEMDGYPSSSRTAALILCTMSCLSVMKGTMITPTTF